MRVLATLLMLALLAPPAGALRTADAPTSPPPAPVHSVFCECVEAIAVGVGTYEANNVFTLDEDCRADVAAISVRVTSGELAFDVVGGTCLFNGFWDLYCDESDDGTYTCVEPDGPDAGFAILRADGYFLYTDADDGGFHRVEGQLVRVL